MDTPSIIQKIQYAIAPAVMISSSALLLLGFQNKFSNLANRFRALNHEKRNLSYKTDKDAAEQERLESLFQQVNQLLRRAYYVKNAIVMTYLAILFFAGTSVLIFLDFYTDWEKLTFIVFTFGLLSLWVSAILMILETSLFYHIINIENKS